jgi:hypothetical protein
LHVCTHRPLFFFFFSKRAEASFKQTQFSVADPADFKCAKFHGKVDFNDAQFSWNAIFKGALFSEEASFNRAKFKEGVNFEDITIEKYSSFEMIDTYFYNVSGLFEHIEEKNKVFKKIRKRSKTLKTEFLPKNFSLILGEETTAKYPMQSRQIKDDMYLLDKKERISRKRNFKYKTLFFLWRFSSDYGRSFKRWAAWSIGIAVLFAVIFTPPRDLLPDYLGVDWLVPDWWINLCNDIGPNFEQTAKYYQGKPLGFWSSLYFSIVTFTTLGFGDVITANWMARFLVAVEVILGYIMLGGLISIFANKLARRS